jgi:multidrug efflux pump subunit AcrB
MKKIYAIVLEQKLFFKVLMYFVFLVGMMSYVMMKKEAFPAVNVPVINITIPYPGASAQEVEVNAVELIEDEIKSITGIDSVNSISSVGMGQISVEVDKDILSMQEARSEIEAAIGRTLNLPTEIKEIVINSIKTDTLPIIKIFANGKDDDKVYEYLTELKEKLERVSNVSKVNELGVPEKEVSVEVDVIKLRKYELELNDVINKVRLFSESTPLGKVYKDKNKAHEILFYSKASLDNYLDLLEAPLLTSENGFNLKLKDVATVKFIRKNDSEVYKLNGRNSQGLEVVKKSNGDIIAVADAVKSVVNANKLDGYEIAYVEDESVHVKKRLSVLRNNFGIGLILVIIILTIILPLRLSVVVALGIPFSIFGTLTYFYMTGISLNLISMIGLILVLGILVDDAIVFVESCYKYIEKGIDFKESITRGLCDVLPAVAASLTTTILGFLPILFMDGIMGEFLRYIAIGVIAALLISLVEANTVLPVHIYSLRKSPKLKAKSKKTVFFDRVKDKYRSYITKVVGRKYIALFAFVVLFVSSGLMFAKGKFVFFATAEVDRVVLQAEVDTNSSRENLENIHEKTYKLLNPIVNNKISSIQSRIGGVEADGPPGTLTSGSNSIFEISFYLNKDNNNQKMANLLIKEIDNKLKKFKLIKKARLQFKADGPGMGNALELIVKGTDVDKMKVTASELEKFVASIPGVINLDSTLDLTEQVNIEYNQNEISELNLNSSNVAQSFRTYLEGSIAARITVDGERRDVRVRGNDRTFKTFVNEHYVKNSMGNLIPIKNFIKTKSEEGITVINRRDYLKNFKVTAQVDNISITSKELNEKVAAYIKENQDKVPEGVTVGFEGEEKDRVEAVTSVFQGLIVVVFLVFLVLIILFKSLSYPFVIALTILFSVISVALTFVTHGETFSFFAFLGVLALAGVVVNDSIIMIDSLIKKRKDEDKHDKRLGPEEVIDAAVSRLRPITLTSLTTFLGVIPTAYGLGGSDAFISPIALALGWGIMFSTVFVLTFLPVFLAIRDDIINLIYYRKD